MFRICASSTSTAFRQINRVAQKSRLMRPVACRTRPVDQQQIVPQMRLHSTTPMDKLTMDKLTMDKLMEEFGEKVLEARDEIEVALENVDTVYFNDDKKVAVELFDQVMQLWTDTRADMSPDDLNVLEKRVGLKLEELKALRAQLEESDH